MDPTTGSSLFHTKEGVLLNHAIVNGIKFLSSKQIKHNEANHSIKDTDYNFKTLVNITFDLNLTKSEKISKIINEMMIPNNVDIIVTGQYIDKGKVVYVRPIIIEALGQKIITKIAIFQKDQFICKDSNDQNVKTLCPYAYDKIAALVTELLESIEYN